MGFTKLDSGITKSSVWSESLATRVVWVSFLAEKDQNGMVKAARSGMIRIANVTPEQFDAAVAILEAPDHDSRTTDNEGRRLQKVDGGWFVLNHQIYRDYSYSDSPDAIKQKRYRERKKELETLRNDGNALPLLPNDGNRSVSVSVSASVSGIQEGGLGEGLVPESVKGTIYEKAFVVYCKVRQERCILESRPFDTIETLEMGLLPQLISIAGRDVAKRKRVLEAAVVAKSMSLFDPDKKTSFQSVPAEEKYVEPKTPSLPAGETLNQDDQVDVCELLKDTSEKLRMIDF